MAIFGAGALLSGLIFNRHTWRVLMLVGCLAVFEIMVIVLSYHLGWDKLMRRVICLVSGVALAVISFKIRKTED